MVFLDFFLFKIFLLLRLWFEAYLVSSVRAGLLSGFFTVFSQGLQRWRTDGGHLVFVGWMEGWLNGWTEGRMDGLSLECKRRR